MGGGRFDGGPPRRARAADGDGTLEFGCHPDMTRELVVDVLLPVRGGRVPVPDGLGFGAAPDLGAPSRFRTRPA